ncbi:Serpentine Receptor, class D (Delta) [Caenorhabditis elegans]|uniref:Serpentine Receptor, class D (Delta) n=1 Tax=Caenorhabditis elegans TaxID=6239 RepID=G4RX35_CAEEL|nr:Serpentine Receptor, class D (Delta) [Caenorhabditis elegans]CCD63540.2 Serpentine Receptor, class D (Delta) [Caenorhabditis elegans]|eukprot:NP_001263662.1 Serpentine Receptor, class D (delta) [Caenorhabditis elegans]
MSDRSNYSNRFVSYVNAYFHFFLVAGLTFQCILLYLIRTKSPASLDQLKYFLYNTAFVQILVIICGYFTQHRSLPNSTTFAVLANGPCRVFGTTVCFGGYHVFLGVTFCVALSISNTVIYRFLILRRRDITKKHLIYIIILSYVPGIITTIIPFTDDWNFSVAVNQTYLEHPTYDLSYYSPFPGFANINSPQFLAATAILGIGAYGIPLCSFILTRSILNLIRAHSNMSTRTKTQAKTLVHGLACQIVIPLLCYIPIFSVYTYSQLNQKENIASEHLLMILTCFPALIDPFISLYFVVPYRNAILRVVTNRKEEEKSTMAVASTVSIRQVSANIMS